MKFRSLPLALLLPMLTACPWQHGDHPGIEPTHPRHPRPPGRGNTGDAPAPSTPAPTPANIDPLVKAYTYNPTERPNKPFLTSENTLGPMHDYQSGFPLSCAEGEVIRNSLTRPMVAPVKQNFRPDVAIVIFDKNKNPVQCIEVCRGNGRVQVYDTKTRNRRQFAEQQSPPMRIIQRHLSELLPGE